MLVPARGVDKMPTTIAINPSDGGVVIHAENNFNAFRDDELSQPWLSIRTVITERGSLARRGRSRTLSIEYLDIAGDKGSA